MNTAAPIVSNPAASGDDVRWSPARDAAGVNGRGIEGQHARRRRLSRRRVADDIRRVARRGPAVAGGGPLSWDLGFLAFALLLIVLGSAMHPGQAMDRALGALLNDVQPPDLSLLLHANHTLPPSPDHKTRRGFETSRTTTRTQRHVVQFLTGTGGPVFRRRPHRHPPRSTLLRRIVSSAAHTPSGQPHDRPNTARDGTGAKIEGAASICEVAWSNYFAAGAERQRRTRGLACALSPAGPAGSARLGSRWHASRSARVRQGRRGRTGWARSRATESVARVLQLCVVAATA